MEASYQTAALTASGLSWATVAGTRPLTAKTGVRVPVRIKLRTPMLLRFRCNFMRLKDDLQLLNVPQTCASHGPSYRAHPRLPPALSSGGLENERTTPRATFRRGKLSLQSNEIFRQNEPNSGEIASSC